MINHPSSATLSRYLDGDLGAFRRRRVASHLARCAECGEKVQDWRGIGVALRSAPLPPLPASTFQQVSERRAAGERVILPTARPGTRGRTLRAAAAAAAVLLAVGAGAILRRPPELAAEASTLVLSPAAPRAGEEVRVHYHATGKLAGEQRLVLRARVFGPGGGRLGTRHAVLANLVREGRGSYRGSFRLSDSVAYAVLAVEDARGERVDYDPARWDVVRHGADGRPLASALERRIEYRSEWASSLALETAREMTRIYPDSTASWLARYYHEDAAADRTRGDSIKAEFRTRFAALERRRQAAPVPAEEMARLASFASALDDSAAAERWSGRLLRDAPAHPAAVMHRAYVTRAANRGNARATLTALEQLWTEAAGSTPELALAGFMTARPTGDAATILRWAERLERADPAWDPMVARALSEIPRLRAEAAARLRRQIRWLDGGAEQLRPIGHTRTDYDLVRSRARAYFLGQLGRSLLDGGQVPAGLDTLARAVDAGWNMDLFRIIANTKLAIGDTAGALPVFARIAVDPATTPAFSDSVKARVGSRFQRGEWASLRKAAREELDEYVWSQAVNRGVRGGVRLVDIAGRPYLFRGRGDAPTLVAFWSPDCQPSVEQLRQLDELSRRLGSQGVRVLAVTDGASGKTVQRFMAEKGYSFPVFLDVDGDAARAFDNRATPRYLVLDSGGRIRFDSYGPDDVVRQVAALRGSR